MTQPDIIPNLSSDINQHNFFPTSENIKNIVSYSSDLLGNQRKYQYLHTTMKQNILNTIKNPSEFDSHQLYKILLEDAEKSGFFEPTKDDAQKTGDMRSVLLYINTYLKYVSNVLQTEKDHLSIELALWSFDAKKYLMDSDRLNGAIWWLPPPQNQVTLIQQLNFSDKLKKIPGVFRELLGNKHFPSGVLSTQQAETLAKIYKISEFYTPEKKIIMHKRMLVGSSPDTPVFNDLQTRILFEFGFLDKQESDTLSKETTESKVDTDFTHFNPLDYLHEFYRKIGEENSRLLNTFNTIYHDMPSGGSLLEFGGGPTLYQLISASSKANEIIFSEYGTESRAQIQAWLEGHKDAFDRNDYFVFVAKLEHPDFDTLAKPAQDSIVFDMHNRLKSVIKDVIPCDAYKNKPLTDTKYIDKQFDTVSVNFVPESATYNAIHYKGFVKNIASLLKVGGTLVMSYLIGSDYYHVGNMKFPAFAVDSSYVEKVLTELGFSDIKMIKGPKAEADQGYEGMGCVTAKLIHKNISINQ